MTDSSDVRGVINNSLSTMLCLSYILFKYYCYPVPAESCTIILRKTLKISCGERVQSKILLFNCINGWSCFSEPSITVYKYNHTHHQRQERLCICSPAHYESSWLEESSKWLNWIVVMGAIDVRFGSSNIMPLVLSIILVT